MTPTYKVTFGTVEDAKSLETHWQVSGRQVRRQGNQVTVVASADRIHQVCGMLTVKLEVVS